MRTTGTVKTDGSLACDMISGLHFKFVVLPALQNSLNVAIPFHLRVSIKDGSACTDMRLPG